LIQNGVFTTTNEGVPRGGRVPWVIRLVVQKWVLLLYAVDEDTSTRKRKEENQTRRGCGTAVKDRLQSIKEDTTQE
jgi:hypothetical protein